jgi:hypothetical protein
MYSGVPMIPREAGPLADVSSERSALTILARPKSPTFTNPSSAGRASSLLHQKNVCWFQIAVKNSLVVRSFDSGNNLPHDVYRTLRIDRSLAS